MYVGMRVVVSGLVSKPEYNGRVGRAVSFETSRARYAIDLDGERLALKAENLSLAPDEEEESRDMTPEEESLELLECARYGEDEELQQLINKGTPVNFTDDQGNTALHRASANGHLSIVKLLALAGSNHVANNSGNFPLHWAVQQGHLEVTKALLQLYPEADVLAQNSFGKSVSSEAFAKEDPALLEAVLAHTSAAKLEPTAGGENEMDGEATHAFRFMGDDAPLVYVRELGELGGDDPMRVLGKTADEDRTGLQLWAASLVLSRWLVELRPQLIGRGVIELGAGCGLCGIVAARVCQAAPVVLTDLAVSTMENLRHNLSANQLAPPEAQVQVLDWRDRETWPAAQPVVIGADLIYAMEVHTHSP